MKYGICICGLNGSGKTTLAAALARELHFIHMDIEQYYFTASDQPYSSARTRKEVEKLLLSDIKENPHFVFSAVCGDMPAEITQTYALAVYLDVPREIRMKRIRQRAMDRFGDRIQPGGDMYEQEERFFAYAQKRTPDKIETWLKNLSCPILRLDGTKPIQENVEAIKAFSCGRRGTVPAVDEASL